MEQHLSDHVKFRHYRDYLGLSQMELSSLMGTTQTPVARWESGAVAIVRQVMRHLRVLVERKLYEDIRQALTALKPDISLADFESVFAIPDSVLTLDNLGRVYLGFVSIDGHR